MIWKRRYWISSWSPRTIFIRIYHKHNLSQIIINKNALRMFVADSHFKLHNFGEYYEILLLIKIFTRFKKY